MLKEYRAQAILGVVGGIIFFLVGYLIAAMPQSVYVSFGRIIMFGAYALFVCGCFMYAKGKGHNWYFGILGLLGPLGLLMLYILKDRSKIILKNRKSELS